MAAIFANGRGHAAGGAFFHQEDHTASTARSAGLGGYAPIPGSQRNELVNQRSGDTGSIGAA